MASTTFCDWCGELIEVPAGDRAPELKVHGRQEYFFFESLADGFNIHAGYLLDEYGTIDPDCCLGKLEALLRERASWAHDPEQRGTEWRLVSREGRTLTTREKLRAARDADLQLREEEQSARDRQYAAWKALPKAERLEMIRCQLIGNQLTIRELSEKLESEFPDLAIYEQRIRPIVAEMFKDGALAREGEKWRSGPSIRYRYMLAEGDES